MKIQKLLEKIEKQCTKKNSKEEYKEIWTRFINNEIGRIELCSLFEKLQNEEKLSGN